jgi:hypothetical protein
MNRNYESLNYSQETREDKEKTAIRYENGVTVEEATATDKPTSIRFAIPSPDENDDRPLLDRSEPAR